MLSIHFNEAAKVFQTFKLIAEVWTRGTDDQGRIVYGLPINICDGKSWIAHRGPETSHNPQHDSDQIVHKTRKLDVSLNGAKYTVDLPFAPNAHGICLDIVAVEPTSSDPNQSHTTCTRRRASATVYCSDMPTALVAFGDLPVVVDTNVISARVRIYEDFKINNQYEQDIFDEWKVVPLIKGHVLLTGLKLVSAKKYAFTAEDAAEMNTQYLSITSLDKTKCEDFESFGDDELKRAVACTLGRYPPWMHCRITFWLLGKYIADVTSMPLCIEEAWWLHQLNVVTERFKFMHGREADLESSDIVARVVKAEAMTHKYVPDYVWYGFKVYGSDVITDLLVCTANDCEDFSRFVCRAYWDLCTRRFENPRLQKLQATARKYECIICCGLIRSDGAKPRMELQGTKPNDYAGHSFCLMMPKGQLDNMQTKHTEPPLILDAIAFVDPNLDEPYVGQDDQIIRAMELQARKHKFVSIMHQSSYYTTVHEGVEVHPVDVHSNVISVFRATEHGPKAYELQMRDDHRRCINIKTLLDSPEMVRPVEFQVTSPEMHRLCSKALAWERPTPLLTKQHEGKAALKLTIARELNKGKTRPRRAPDYVLFLVLHRLLGPKLDADRADLYDTVNEFFQDVSESLSWYVDEAEELGSQLRVGVWKSERS